jgi:hypothetical protein
MNIKWITISDGEVFEGTPEQFSDCFFSNVSVGSIQGWAEKESLSFKIEMIDGSIFEN